MTKILILIIIVLAVLGFWLYQKGEIAEETSLQESESPSVSPMPMPTSTPAPNSSSNPSTSPVPSSTPLPIKTFTISGQPFSFTPNEITVDKGDTVRITFKNTSGNHDFVIDEFNVRIKVIQAGQEETIEFVADKIGTFEFYCSVGTHRQLGMKGELIVK